MRAGTGARVALAGVVHGHTPVWRYGEVTRVQAPLPQHTRFMVRVYAYPGLVTQ